MATSPDLPTPITPDEQPGHLPVEPDQGPSNPSTPPMDPERPFVPERASAHFIAHRSFMRAAAFRWPTFRTLTGVISH
ncbi:MAG: hypothetical protein EOO26_15500 [Comamonadaceae bacterium]|nr:MAG: hypothetical protein EOO26_15500 [Comamonadaceae bacterium]